MCYGHDPKSVPYGYKMLLFSSTRVSLRAGKHRLYSTEFWRSTADHNRNACPLWQTSTYIQGLSAEIHTPTGYSWRIFVPTPLRQRSGQLYTRSPHTQLIAHCLGRPFSQKFNPTRKNVQYCLSKLKWLPIFFVSSVTPWPLFRFSIYFTSQNFVMTFQDFRIEKEIVLKLYFFKA